MSGKTYVTASEIGDFIYCERGWWLRQRGLLGTTEAMVRGTEGHNRLASLLWWHKAVLIFALLLIGISILGVIAFYIWQTFF